MEIEVKEGGSPSISGSNRRTQDRHLFIDDVKKLLVGNAYAKDGIRKYLEEEGLKKSDISTQTPSYIVILEKTEDHPKVNVEETENGDLWFELDNFSLKSSSGDNMRVITSEGEELENIVKTEATGKNFFKTRWENSEGEEGVSEGYPVLLEEM